MTPYKSPYFELSLKGIRMTSLDEHIKYCLKTLLFTRKGERSLYPQMGSRLIDFMFRQHSARMMDEIKEDIKRTIAENEPRVEVLEVLIDAQALNVETASIKIRYKIIATDQTDSFGFIL